MQPRGMHAVPAADIQRQPVTAIGYVEGSQRASNSANLFLPPGEVLRFLVHGTSRLRMRSDVGA